jgi:hypothetical protein
MFTIHLIKPILEEAIRSKRRAYFPSGKWGSGAFVSH